MANVLSRITKREKGDVQRPEKSKKTLRGHIVLVQEERFRVIDESGRSYLFDLSHKSSVGNEDLLVLAETKTDVLVEYEGEPELETGVARSIRAA